MRFASVAIAALMSSSMHAQSLGGDNAISDFGDGFYVVESETVVVTGPEWPADPVVFLLASDPAGGGGPDYDDTTGFVDGENIDGAPAWASSGSIANDDYSDCPICTPSAQWQTAVLNGEPVVELGDVEGVSTGTPSNFRFLHDGTSDFTIAVVFRPRLDSNGRNSFVFSTAAFASNVAGVWMVWKDNAAPLNSLRFEIPTTSSTYALQLHSAADAWPLDEWNLAIVRCDIGKTGDDCELIKWATVLDDEEFSGAVRDTGDPTHALRVGLSNIATLAGGGGDKDIAFLGIWDTALSDADLDDLRSKVDELYGIAP